MAWLDVALPGVDGQAPVLLLVSKHLGEILAEAQSKAVLVRAAPEHRSPERLCRDEINTSEPAQSTPALLQQAHGPPSYTTPAMSQAQAWPTSSWTRHDPERFISVPASSAP